jgi:hypothetical protein
MSRPEPPSSVVRRLRQGVLPTTLLSRGAASASRLPGGACRSVPLPSTAVRQDRALYRGSIAHRPHERLLSTAPCPASPPPLRFRETAPPRRHPSGFAKPPRPVAIPRHFRETALPRRRLSGFAKLPCFAATPQVSRNRPTQSLSPATIPQVSRNRPPSPLARNRTSRCGHPRCLSSRPPLPSADSCTLSRKRPGALPTVGRRFVFSRRRRDTPFPFRPVTASLSRKQCCPSWRFRESASGPDERGELGGPG